MKKDHIWIGLMCIILGLIIAFQFKFVQNNYLNGKNPTQISVQVTKEIAAIQEEKKSLESEVKDLKNQLKAINDSAAQENAVIKNLNRELDKSKKFAGLSEVKGPGILVTVNNPPSEMNFQYELNIANDYTLVLQLINELNAAGAEAISINGQRIVSRSEIRLAGTAVNVNKVPIAPPYNIRAIGNSDTLTGAISQRYGIVPTLQERGYYVDIVATENIDIPAYNGSTRFDYASTLE